MERRRCSIFVVAGWVLCSVLSSLSFATPSGSDEDDVDVLYPLTPRETPWRGPDGTVLPFKDDEEILEFLRTARVVSMKRVGEGINQTQKVRLEKDGIRMHAAFRAVSKYVRDSTDEEPLIRFEDLSHQPLSRRVQGHRDDYRFEVAAYRLNWLLGLHLVPPTVERKIGKKKGSLQAWVENCMMERERREKGISPPDEWYWNSQMLTMQLFDNLIGNRDRHQGNLLIDTRWEIWLIDHTQGFRRFDQPHNPTVLQYCDRDVWVRLKRLDRDTMKTHFSGLLGREERNALLERHRFIVDQIQSLIERSGEQAVLF